MKKLTFFIPAGRIYFAGRSAIFIYFKYSEKKISVKMFKRDFNKFYFNLHFNIAKSALPGVIINIQKTRVCKKITTIDYLINNKILDYCLWLKRWIKMSNIIEIIGNNVEDNVIENQTTVSRCVGRYLDT